MENASDALKIAMAVLVFLLALSVAIFAFTKANQAATSVLGRTKIQYYNTENIRVSENRIVGIETIIPTLYSYYKEGYTILFYDGRSSYNSETQELGDTNIKPLTLYYSEALPERLALSTLQNKNDTAGKLPGTNYNRAIYGFDANDEDIRQEPWLHDELHSKMFIKSFVTNNTPNAQTWDMSRKIDTRQLNFQENNKLTMNFRKGNFLDVIGVNSLSVATNAKFIERIGTYNLTKIISTDEDGNKVADMQIDSSEVEFSNDGTVQNDEGTQKRVIQYIYIGN